MIKLSANVSKKVPIPGLDYSSQNFNAGMEVEIGSNTSRGELKEKYQELYRILEDSIQEQISDVSIGANQNAPQRQPQRATGSGNGGNGHGGNGHSGGGSRRNGSGGNGKKNDIKATDAQVRAIFAIAGSKGYDKRGIQDMLSESYGVSSPKQLHIGDASSLIDSLKNGNGGA